MTFWETVLISGCVSLDTFAAALAIGLATLRMSPRQICLATAALTLPSVVILLVSQSIAWHWLPADRIWTQSEHTSIALFWIGLAMIIGPDRKSTPSATETNWLPLLILGGVSSFDVGMFGLTMGKEQSHSTSLLILIPAFTLLFVLTGLLLGSKLNTHTGRYAEIAGGSLLIGMAQNGLLW